FVAALEGVTPDEIARVEREYQIRLPDSYRQFVLNMGANSAGFHLFGPTQNQRFPDVAAQVPDESYPTQEYFKIARADDERMINAPDHFLDLRRSDGMDAPIVAFEADEEFTLENVRDYGFTFLEQADRRLFGHLANLRSPERALLTILSAAT